jgi:Ca2+/H+ antiporter, TMEM165/GDT1 family
MQRHCLARGVKFALFAALALAVGGVVVMCLWNWLMPALFSWHEISFWQALGLLLLSRILVGGFRCGPAGHGHWRHRLAARFAHMTPEEREKFVQGVRGCCCHDESAPATKPDPDRHAPSV